MTVGARVIALGQVAAGDDGVGFAVLDELRRRGVPPGVELLRAPDPSALVSLLEAPGTVVVVDAALGAEPGAVVEAPAEALGERGVRPLSSHGMSVVQALGLARLLAPGDAPAVHVVAVTIARPDRWRIGLSPAVKAAVPRAADAVLALVGR